MTAIAIAPDGTWLASTSDSTLRISDTVTGTVNALMRVDQVLHDCAWNPSGRLVAAAGDAGIYLFTFSS